MALACHQFVDGQDLEEATLPGHQQVDPRHRLGNVGPHAINRFLVTLVAMRGRLPRTDVLVVLHPGHGHGLVKAAQILIECRQSVVVFGFKHEFHCPAQAPDPDQHFLTCREFCTLELIFEMLDPRDDGLLFPSCQELRSRCRQQVVAATHQHLVLLYPETHAGIELPEFLVDGGQQGLVVLTSNVDHVVESVEVGFPGDQLAAQVGQVEIILQPGLEIVRRHQLHEVVGLRRLGQRTQANDPVFVLANLFADQCLQELARANAFNGGVEFVDFGHECIEGPAVMDSSPAVYIELSISVRQCQHGFLCRAIGHLALGEDTPGHDRSLVVFRRHAGPAGTEQCLVGKRSVDSHTIEVTNGVLVLALLQQHGAEHQVGLVTNRQFTRVAALDKSCLVELVPGRETVPSLQVGYTQIVSGESSITL